MIFVVQKLCPELMLPCPNIEFGCQFKGKKAEMQKHLNGNLSSSISSSTSSINPSISSPSAQCPFQSFRPFFEATKRSIEELQQTVRRQAVVIEGQQRELDSFRRFLSLNSTNGPGLSGSRELSRSSSNNYAQAGSPSSSSSYSYAVFSHFFSS